MGKNKAVFTNHSMVSLDNNTILFQKESNGVYFRNKQSSILEGGVRKFDSILKYLFKLKHILNSEITVDVRNTLESLDSEYEEVEYFDEVQIKRPVIESVDVNGEIISDYLVMNNVKDATFKKITLPNVTNYTGDIKLIIEYSEDKINWKECDSFNFGEPLPVGRTKEFILTHYAFNGDNGCDRWSLNESFFRNSEDVVLTKIDFTDASNYEREGTIYSSKFSNGSMKFYIGVTDLPNELTMKDNVKLSVPFSSNHWDADFYGYIKNPLSSAKDVNRKTKKYNNTVFQSEQNNTISLDYSFSSSKIVDTKTRNMYVRIKLKGNGTIQTDGKNMFSLSANATKVIKEDYLDIVDEENDIMIERIEGNTLIPSRNLKHKEINNKELTNQRNYRQIISINLLTLGGSKIQITRETYLNNYIEDIKLKDTGYGDFLLFENGDSFHPTINIPSKIKQLLYEKNNIFINKRIVDSDVNFIRYGFSISEGISKYNSECEKTSDINFKDLKGLKFLVSTPRKFETFLISNPIEAIIKDSENKTIFPGVMYLSNNTGLDESNIKELIKAKKGFGRISIILYSESNKNIESLVDALYAGDDNPQDVFLVCQNSTDSNINNCYFNKTELGNRLFRIKINESIKNKKGLQFTNIESILDSIDEFANSNFETQSNVSMNNIVGVNVYDFTNSSIEIGIMNRYGFYINNVIKNYKPNTNFKMLGYSESNSLDGVIQYDINSNFSSEIDLTDVFSDAYNDDVVETNITGKSISVSHDSNMFWKHVIGDETVEVFDIKDKKRYSYGISNSGSKTTLKVQSLFQFTSANAGENEVIVNVKDKNAIISSYRMKFLIDFKEAVINKLNLYSSNTPEEKGYTGKTESTYTKDTFINIDINLDGEYDFNESDYLLVLYHEKDEEYKIEKKLIGKWSSKVLSFHIDDIKNTNDTRKRLKFGKWKAKLIRTKFDHIISEGEFEIPLNINDVLNIRAFPVNQSIEDIENSGLEAGNDVNIELGFNQSEYFKKIKDIIYFCKEVKFCSNKINMTANDEYFTFDNEVSLESVTSHETNSSKLEDKTSMRWFISGKQENASNSYLKPIANLGGDARKTKSINVQLILFDDKIIDSPAVVIGETTKIHSPIIYGTEEHYQKLLKIEAKTLDKTVESLTPSEKEKVKVKLKSLGEFNYNNQQIIKDQPIFVFYNDLIELQFDFGISEYFSISQTNKANDLIPVTRDGKVRYLIDEKSLSEDSYGTLIVKSYIKLTDGTTVSSEERVITFLRKKKPSIINTGDDYTKYVQYETDERNYYNLKTVIQSKIMLEDLNGNYSSKWISYIQTELVDVDKRTVIARGPNVEFYDGFIPQRFVFDSGLTSDDLNSIGDDDRITIEKTKKYKEIEKILNDKIFKFNKHEGQTFYLRFKAVEVHKNYFGHDVEVIGKDTFYPIKFIEKLKELVIIPASGIIVQEEDRQEQYYTYKNKVSFVLESNNAEYFMYRTDRTAAFQKVYPKTIGYLKTVKLIVSTYDVGNHVLEVKQKAEGEVESNVYSMIVEKLNSIVPPKITGQEITDTNPYWNLHPVDGASKFEFSIISNEEIHSTKSIKAMPYETKIEPEYYLDNGYHIITAKTLDKINNSSEESYFVTRKIGRPLPSEITGLEKTSENYIEWEWKSQYFEGVSKYEVEINGSDKYTLPASLDGFNRYSLRYFQGRDLVDGTYEIRIWAINELGNKSYSYSSFITEKGTKIKELGFKFYKYKNDYTNKLEAKVITDDKAIKFYEYEIFKIEDSEFVSVAGVMETKSKVIPFLTKDGNRIELKDGQYQFAIRGVNYIDERTEYVKTPFIFKIIPPKKPIIYYIRSVKSQNPLIFVKPDYDELVNAVEIKIGDNNFEKIKNNVFRPNYSIPIGINNITIKLTDYAGNTSEFSDFVDVTSKGANMFQEDFVVDMIKPVVTFDFNLYDMNNFGHSNFRVVQENLGIDILVDIKNANTIEIPLTSDNKELYPDGNYIFTIKLYNDETKGYDYIADHFIVTINSIKPNRPYFLNVGYDNIEYNTQYIRNRDPKWLWQSKNIELVKEYIVTLTVYDEENNTYIDYSNGQFKEYSTQLVGQFQVPTELKDGTYKLSVKSLGYNNLYSESESFFFIIKNSLPIPPHFDIGRKINKKYENKNTNVGWLWEDLNRGNDVFVKYKIKLNEEDFSDEFDSSITYYEEKRTLKDGPNKLMVIGCDKAGNWSTANEANANQIGVNYLSHTKIIDTSKPEKMADEDVIINILDSKTFEVLFRNENKQEEYFLFELFILNQSREEVFFVKGNTLNKDINDIYFNNEYVRPGISLGKLDGNLGYCEIRETSSTKVEKNLYFTNLLNNDYYLRIYGVDYAGNISAPLVKEVKIQDLTKLKPSFILPKELYTNNSTLIFQWILNEPNIKNWEYQFITPYNNSTPDLTNDAKWKSINENTYSIYNIPKLIGGRDADGQYTFYVRAVFDEYVTQVGTDLSSFKKSDIASINIILDRKNPKGIIFTNKNFTSDNTSLNWNWYYTKEGDEVAGVYVTFNPNLPINEWEKLENKTEYSSFKERTDGRYTLYAKTYDLAGNINPEVYSSSITIDRIPPFKPVIIGGTHICTNIVPTIYWENDINYFKYAWIVVTLEEFNKFKSAYDNLTNIEKYTLTNDDWKYIFSNKRDEIQINNVNEEIKKFNFKQNDSLTENFVSLNSSQNKFGISNEGDYVFLLSGFDENYNWAEEFEYQFITYDRTLPDITKIKFTHPKYVVTTDRRPEWIWTTSNDVVKCEYFLEKNNYDDGSVHGILTKEFNKEESYYTYKFQPDFNLTKGNYNLVVNCYDNAENSVKINKSIIIEGETSELEEEFFDIYFPNFKNRVRCKMNRFSDVYYIVDIDIDKNAMLTYRDMSDNRKGFEPFEIGKTPLRLDGTYQFNVVSYSLKIK